jgi:hypothetical protein
MPAKTGKQRKFMGAELGRKRAGKKTKTGMSEKKRRDGEQEEVTGRATSNWQLATRASPGIS